MDDRGKAKRRPGLIATLIAFVLIIGSFDVFLAGRLVERVRTYGFPAAPAEVVESYVEQWEDDEGRPRYEAVVRYAYRVGGRTVEGAYRGRDDGFGDSEASAVETVDRHPPGRGLNAYYDPGTPDRSTLVRGVRGEDLFVLLLAPAFNLVVAGLVGLTAAGMTSGGPGATDRDGPGVPVREVDGRLHVRPPTVPRNIVPVAVAAGATALLSAIVVGITWSIMGDADLPHWLPISGLWWTALAGVEAYGRSNPGRAGAKGEIVIDRAARTITLPPADGGGDPKVIRFDQVMNVRGIGWADEQAAWWGSGVFHPTIAWREERDGRKVGESLPLGAAADRAGADRFARWLEKRVGLRG